LTKEADAYTLRYDLPDVTPDEVAGN